MAISGVYDTADDVRASPLLAPVLPAAVGCDGCGAALPAPGAAASPDDPAVVLVHGDEDPIAPLGTAVRYRDALTEVGVDVALHAVGGAGHDGPALGAVVQEVLDDVLAGAAGDPSGDRRP